MIPTNVGSVRLIDAKTRVVEVVGPTPMGSRHATDRQLSLQVGRMPLPEKVGFCFSASDRSAKFLVDTSPSGNALLEMLGRHPRTPVRPASLYGPRGWLVTDW